MPNDTARPLALGRPGEVGNPGELADLRAFARRHHVGFWLVAGAFFTLTAFGTTPTPLWPLYAVRSHLSDTQITTAFAIMVVGAAAGLRFLGHLSDRWGRRRVIAPALAVALIADFEMAAFPQFAGLLVGRLLTGVAVGLMATTATTYLVDLYGAARPSKPGSGVPTTVAGLANLGGFSVGPLLAGALAQWGPGDNLTTPYIALGILLAMALLAVLVTPETVDRVVASETASARFELTPGRAGLFAAGAAVAFATFAVFGIFSSLGSLIVHQELRVTSPFTWGVAAFVTLGASAAAQLLVARWTPVRTLVVGLSCLPIGLAIVVMAVNFPSMTSYLVGAAIAGAGAGVLFKAGLSVAVMAAVPTARAGVLSVFFVIAYLGMGIPPVLLAVAENYWSAANCLLVFGTGAVLASAAATVASLRFLSGKRV